ncbi:hypothetical protein ACKWTF_015493 [Chironomus riparius]
MTHHNKLDILGDKSVPINQDLIINLTKENVNNINKETINKCKIIKFSTDLNFNEILLIISKLEPKCHPNLFIFAIEDNNFGSNLSEKVEILQKFLLEFGKLRPIILQITSNVTKIYYKEEISDDFIEVEEKNEGFNDFSSFLWFYSKVDSKNLESVVLEKLPSVKNSSLILRFLRTLKLSFDFWINLVEICAKSGSKPDLLAAIDAPLNNKATGQQLDPENFLSWMIGTTSVLHIAVQAINHQIIEFLVINCRDLIQQHPLDHQIEISTAAFNISQLEVLCDLIELADYPFPKELKQVTIKNERLLKIIDDRAKFHENLQAENLKEIEKFASKNPKIKFVYNFENKSALCNALDAKKFQAFFLLQALRFEDKEIEHYTDKIDDDDDKKKASKFAAVQRGQNVNSSTSCEDYVIQLLLIKSFIYNRSSTDEPKEKFIEIIKKWFGDINRTKFGPMMLNASSQCDDLKIIFDFECNSVKNVDVSKSAATLGTTYPVRKFIFIGAKLSGEKTREQQIKGVLAHEICHYVMRLVYQNKESPFYKEDEEGAKKFGIIVTEIEAMLFPEKFQPAENDEIDNITKKIDINIQINQDEGLKDISKQDEQEIEVKKVDDECHEVISTVYTCYDDKDWIAELIVRPFQIQAYFDDDVDKLKQLEVKYKSLFKFCAKFVIPELKKFDLTDRKTVQNFNSIAGLLAKIANFKLEFSKLNDINDILKDQIAVVTTNVPKLFLLNVYKHFAAKDEHFVDIRNVFVSQQVLDNSYIRDRFKKILVKPESLKIFVDCSKGFGKILEAKPSIGSSKVIFIMSNANQRDNLLQTLKGTGKNITRKTINYSWMDLTAESQKDLINYKVNFQNKQVSLCELIGDELEVKQENLSLIFDCQLLTKLLEKDKVILNLQTSDIFFDILFQTRNLVRITKDQHFIKQFQNLSIDQMLEDIKNQKFVLISDKAGSGKSWILKNLKNLLIQHNVSKWINIVDLKEFVDEFKSIKTEVKFQNFIIEKILKPKANYEAEIFKKLYKNGKVCLLFDGFDEIAPNCAEFVTKLFQSFQQNGGNQLWIATRDHFEVDLKKSLNLDAVYKLDEFTEDHGAELITTCWILSDLKSLRGFDSKTKIKSHPNYQNYNEKALKISNKVAKLQSSLIGLPKLYKMTADTLNVAKISIIDFSVIDLFEEYSNFQYSRLKQMRKNESISIQYYHKMHELIAMKTLFPDKSNFCDLNCEDFGNYDEQVTAFGMLRKIGNKFKFSHGTIRDYYAAKFVIRNLTKGHKDVVKYLKEFLTIWKFEVIRMFINEALVKEANINKTDLISKIMTIFPNLISKLDEFENVDKLTKQLKIVNSLNFLVDIPLQKISVYEPNFIFNLAFCNKIEIHEAFWSKMSNDTQILMNLMLQKDAYGRNFIHLLIQNDNFQAIELAFNKLKNLLNGPQFQEFISSRGCKNYSVLQIAACESKSVETFQIVWKFVLNSCKSVDEFMKVIEEVDSQNLNIFHLLARYSTSEIFEFVIRQTEIIAGHPKIKTLLYTLSFKNASLLHTALGFNKSLKFHALIWHAFEYFLDPSEVISLINHCDSDGDNIFHQAVYWSQLDIVEFTWNKIKSFINIKERQIEYLFRIGHYNHNLERMSMENQSKDVKVNLWIKNLLSEILRI